jgi:hypothetical protein
MCIQGLVHFSPMVSLLHASFSKPYWMYSGNAHPNQNMEDSPPPPQVNPSTCSRPWQPLICVCSPFVVLEFHSL